MTLNTHLIEAARGGYLQEVVDLIVCNLMQMVKDLNKRHTELILRRIIKELSSPPSFSNIRF
jgi:hypothetical protein